MRSTQSRVSPRGTTARRDGVPPCSGVSWAWQGAEQPPWPPPTRCQQHLPNLDNQKYLLTLPSATAERENSPPVKIRDPGKLLPGKPNPRNVLGQSMNSDPPELAWGTRNGRTRPHYQRDQEKGTVEMHAESDLLRWPSRRLKK